MQTRQFIFQPNLTTILQSVKGLNYEILAGSDLLDKRYVKDIVNLNENYNGKDNYLLLAEYENIIDNFGYIGNNLAAVFIYSQTNNLLNLASESKPGILDLIKISNEKNIPIIVLKDSYSYDTYYKTLKPVLIDLMLNNQHKLQSKLMDIVISNGLASLVNYIEQNLGFACFVTSENFTRLTDSSYGEWTKEDRQKISETIKKCPVNLIDDLIIEFTNNYTMPVFLNKSIVAYVTVEINSEKNNLGIDLRHFIKIVSLAVKLYFKIKSQETSIFTSTQFKLLNDLLSGQVLKTSEIEGLERHFSLDMCEHIMIVACNTKEPLNLNPKNLSKNIIYTMVENTNVFLISAYTKAKSDKAADIINSNIKMLKSAIKQKVLQVGIGRLAKNVSQLAKTYQEARQALIIGSMIHGASTEFNEFVYYYPSLGVRRLLYLIIDHPELRNYYSENLNDLEEYDEEYESELVHSLKVYLDHGSNLNSAARALFIHRHTLNYRLEQIAEILNRDIDSQEVLLDLKIAFLIKEMLGNTILKE